YTKGGKPTLDANPGPGSVFSYWGGDCSGAIASCQLTMDTDKTVYAVFTSGTKTEPSPSPCPSPSSSSSAGPTVGPPGPGCGSPSASPSASPCPSASPTVAPTPCPSPPAHRRPWTTVVCERTSRGKAADCLTRHLRNHGYGIERDSAHDFEAEKHQPSKHKAVLAAHRLRGKGFKEAH